MNEYEDAIRRAEELAARGEFKDAYNTLGVALSLGGPDEDDVRYRRGLYAYRVGHARLNQVEKSPELNRTLAKAACWLSRSEAYLTSVVDEAGGNRHDQTETDLARTKHEQDRFRHLWRTAAPPSRPGGSARAPAASADAR